ncbi:MAG TPA: DNA primase [Exilispira sp.]|nr:DNA primase [Exilispira sp.]HQM88653.1 DNA primase [Exilispira sp.]HQQ19179.1 DNA primase [Exilispira sp.]
MKISKESIEKVRNAISLSELASNYIKVQKTGKNYRALCPFHAEKTPSFYIDDMKGLFYCFGCKASGDIFTFVQKIENCDFYEAILKVANFANIQIQYEESDENEINRKIIKEIFALTAQYYHENLFKSDLALNYLKNRKISAQTIEYFKLGFSTSSDMRFFESIANKYRLSLDFLYEIGLLNKKNQGYAPFFYQRLMIPIQNNWGEIVAFGARRLDEENGPKYINSPEHVLFKKGNILFNYANVRKLKENNSIVLVEGYFDVISLYQSGIKFAVAPLGTAINEYQIKMLSSRFAEIFTLFDMDSAGQKATLTAVEMAIPLNTELKIISLPDSIKDIDEFIHKNEKLKGEQSDSETLLEYFKKNSKSSIDELLYNRLYLKERSRDIAKVYKYFINYLISLNDDIISLSLIKRASKLDSAFSEQQIVDFYNNAKRGKDFNTNNINKSSKFDENEKVEMDFVGFIINSEDFINEAKRYISPSVLSSKKGLEFYQKALISINYNDREQFLRNNLNDEELAYMNKSAISEIEDKKSLLEDYLAYFKLKELEKTLDEINNMIKQEEKNGSYPAELLEKKQFVISNIQRLKAFRKGLGK